MFTFWPHQARTNRHQSRHLRLFDVEMAQMRPQSHPHTPKVVPKSVQIDPRSNPDPTQISTDAPKDHDGRGESFSPTDLLASALRTCLLTVMGITAKRRGFELGEAKADIEKIVTTQTPRRNGTLRVILSLPPNLKPTNKSCSNGLNRIAL